MRRITEVKNPTEELMGIYRSLKSWDISLTLNMTLNNKYFDCAQYDVKKQIFRLRLI